MTTTKPHAALAHTCPFCGADPGQPCRTHRGRGRELDWPHSRRLRVVGRSEVSDKVSPTPASDQKRSRRALCCECGQLRTFSANYHFALTDENAPQSVGHFTDPRGWRGTGTLKCSECGRRTRHAVLCEPDMRYRDYDEQIQAYALGADWPGEYKPDRERLRTEYFAQFPRNPYVNHRWWKSEEREAREAGKTWFRAMCGQPMPMPEQVRENGRDITAMEAPTQISDPERTEHENLDVETGLWWTADGVCVNCLKVRHDWLLKEQRKQLLGQLLEVSATVNQMDAADVAALREHLDRIMGSAK